MKWMAGLAGLIPAAFYALWRFGAGDAVAWGVAATVALVAPGLMYASWRHSLRQHL